MSFVRLSAAALAMLSLAACAAPAEHDVEVALRAALSGLRGLVREKTALSDLWFIFGRGRRPERSPQLSH